MLEGLFDLLRIGRRQPVLVCHAALGPSGSFVAATEGMNFCDEIVPQFRRCSAVEWIRPGLLQRPAGRPPARSNGTVATSIPSTTAVSKSSRRWARLRVRHRKIGRVQIVFAGDPDESEERIAAGIGQCRTHTMRDSWLRQSGRLANRKRSIPRTSVGNIVIRLIIPAAWSVEVVCTTAISWFPNVLRTISRPLDSGAYRNVCPAAPSDLMVATSDFSGLTSSA